MTFGKLTTAAALATVLLGTPAMAEQFGYLNGGWEDYTGMSTIGVDISHVGWAPSAAHAFVASLSPGQAESVTNSCQYALGHQTGYHTEVLMFCHNLIGR
jgi:hypothetical protein